jgi:hypothetical protein
MRALLGACAVIIGINLPAAAAAAEKACNSESDVIALSDYVLTHREDLPKFRKRQHGTIPAYLKLRYQSLDVAQADAMLKPLVDAKVMRADELALAWAIHGFGVQYALERSGIGAPAVLSQYNLMPSVLRALALSQDRAILFGALASLPQDQRLQSEGAIVYALLDQPDAFKEELAKQAETHDQIKLAAGLAATQKDRDAWARFAKRLNDPGKSKLQMEYWYWVPALVGNPPLPREAANDEIRQARDKLNHLWQAGAAMPERDFLMTCVNQTGEVDEALVVATAILAEAARHDAGNPWSMQAAWPMVYRALLDASADEKAVEDILSSIEFGGIQHYKGSIREVLDWMIAVERLKPYVRGEAEDDAMADGFSNGFEPDLPLWKTIAAAVHGGGDLAQFKSDPKALAIAAELLFAAGKTDVLAGLITTATPTEPLIVLAEDFASRMDRACAAYLTTAVEAVIMPDTPIFKFEPAK